MKFNTYFIFIVFVILIMSVSAVNAAEDLDLNDNSTSNLINTINVVSQTSTAVNKNWTVDEFLNNYNTIQDNDVVLIRNGTGTPGGNVVLSQNGIIIFTEGNVIFDGQSKNMHFEITGSNVLISGITFKNFIYDNGGAILWSGGDGTLTGCNFINNNATGSGSGNGGGAVFWSGNAGTLNSCNFSNNVATAGYGGAVFWSGNAGDLTDCTFIDNAADYSGGAVYWKGISGNLTNSIFTSNSVTRSNGGAIYWWGDNGVLSGSIFKNNTAKQYGGAIAWWNGVKSFLSNSSFSGNSASQGGGVYWNAANGIVAGCSFIANTATSTGGGLYWHGATGNVTSCSFTNNHANRGAGVYWWATYGLLSDSIFTGNSATGNYGNGAGVYWWGANGLLSDSIFTGNSATGSYGYGGAVYWDGDKGRLTSSNFTYNTAKSNGGAVYWNDPNGSLTSSNFAGNTANWGAGLWWRGSDGILSGSTFINNTARHSGGGVDWQGTNANIVDSKFINNKAIGGNGNGGGVYGDGGADKGSLTGCTFIGNIADNRGGGLTWHGNNFNLSNSTFINNTANSLGGGVYWYTADGNLTGCNFTNNTSKSAAGVYWNGAGGRLTSSNFIGNVADIRGAGVYWYGINGILSDCTFVSNIAKDSDICGSAIYWQGTNGTLTRSIFTNNTAKSYGGAVYWTGTNGTLADSNFTGNTASNKDGGAVWWGGANGVLSGSIFTSNTAKGYGGAVYWTGSDGLLNGCIFTGNTAKGYGGAVSWHTAGSMVNCNFVNSKWANSNSKSNGMYIQDNLHITGGNGIVDLFNNGTLSGVSIVVLNNETYFVYPNQFMNLTAKIMSGDLTIVDAHNKLSFTVADITYTNNQIGIRESDGSYYVINYRTPSNVPQNITVSANYSKAGNVQYKKGTIVVRSGLSNITLNVTSNDAVYGQPVVISVFLDKNDATGSIIAIIDGVTYNSKIVNGKAIFQIYNLPAGVYTATVSFPGDDMYMATTANTTFKVLKATPVLNVSVANSTYGTDTTISVTISDTATGSIIITINNRSYTKKIVNGEVNFVLSDLDAGSYNIDVKYSGDGNFTNCTVNTDFMVNKNSANMKVNVATDNDKATITVTVNPEATGTVTITIDGNEYIIYIANGKVSFKAYYLATGNHIVDVKYSGDANFLGENLTHKFSIKLLNSGLRVIVGNITYGDTATIIITINPEATGTVAITVNGRTETVTPTRGVAVLKVPGLVADSYTVTVNYGGDTKFSNGTASTKFTVSKLDACMNVVNIDYEDKKTVFVTVSPAATGKVNITVNGVVHEIDIVDGKAKYTIVNPTGGKYSVIAVYSGDVNFNNATVNVEFIVDRINPDMAVGVTTIDNMGKDNIITENVTIATDSTNQFTDIVDGKTTLVVSDLAVDNYTDTVKYDDVNSNATANFTIGNVDPSLDVIIENITYGNNATVIVTVSPAATGKVNITVNGATYEVGIVGGKANLVVSGLAPGKYSVIVYYGGDANFAGFSRNTTFKVAKIDSGMNVAVGSINYGNNAAIIITVNPYATGSVAITVNGATHKVDIVDGKAICPLVNLSAGVYTATAYYGDVNFNDFVASVEFIVKINLDRTVEVTAVDNKIKAFDTSMGLVAG